MRSWITESENGATGQNGVPDNFTSTITINTTAVVMCEIKLLHDNYFSLSRRPSENNFILARRSLFEILSKLVKGIVAGHEYFPAYSMSLK